MENTKIISFDECDDKAYGNTIVQYQMGDIISFAFSEIDVQSAQHNPSLLEKDVQKSLKEDHERFGQAKYPLWSDLSKPLLEAIMYNPFDMHFVEHGDESFAGTTEAQLWKTVCSLGLDSVIRCGEDDALMTIYAGTIGAINWTGHDLYGAPCFDHKALQPFRIAITETFVREVEIYAADKFEAQEIAEELCNEGVIDLNADDFSSRDTECRGIARPNDLALHESFDKNGKISPVKSLDAQILGASARAVKPRFAGEAERDSHLPDRS